jgi:hypothetical protein
MSLPFRDQHAQPATRFSRGQERGLLSEAVLLAAFALTSAISLRAWYYDPAYLKSHYGEMMSVIAAQAQPEDVLLLNNREQHVLYEMYAPPGLDHRFIDRGSVLTAAAAERDLPGLVAGYARAWLVMYGAPEVYDPGHQAEAWLARHGYRAFYQSYLGNYVTLFVLASGPEPELAPLGVAFEGGPRLEGVSYAPPELAPGETLNVTLEWVAVAPMGQDYTVFVQLWDANGQLAAQSDSQPAGGSQPTSGWQPGDVIRDRHALLLPPDLPGGEYSLHAGLYDWLTGARLALSAPRPADGPDHAFLATIRTRR